MVSSELVRPRPGDYDAIAKADRADIIANGRGPLRRLTREEYEQNLRDVLKLPLLMSVPHAGLMVPPEAQPYCGLALEEIVTDGDEGAAEVYAVQRCSLFRKTPPI